MTIDAGLFTPVINGDITWISLRDGNGSAVAVLQYSAALPNAVLAAASDARLKENILPTKVHGLSILNNIPLRQFDWKNDAHPHQELGYVAQEVKDVYPVMVSKDHKTGMYLVADSVLMPVVVKSIQELSAKNSALQMQIDELSDRLKALE
jgi:hypothetical protein